MILSMFLFGFVLGAIIGALIVWLAAAAAGEVPYRERAWRDHAEVWDPAKDAFGESDRPTR